MSECGRDCSCRGEPSRRDVLKIGAGAAGVLGVASSARSAPGDIPPAARAPADKEWFKQLTRPGETIVYRGTRLEHLIFPLGGIGTGSVWLNGRGKLVNWQIFNNIQKNCSVDDTFLAVRVEPEGGPAVTRVLQTEQVGPFTGMRELEFVGQYPVATVRLRDPDVPVALEVEAFNPLIPLNEKDSAIPCVVFRVKAVNRSEKAVRVAFLAALQNAVGHTGSGESSANRHPTYGGNLNRLVQEGAMTAVLLSAQPGRSAEVRPALQVMVDHEDFPLLSEAPVQGLSLASIGVDRGNATLRTVYWIARGDLRRLGGSMLGQVSREVREFGAVLLLSGVDNPLARPVRATVAPGTIRRETVFETFDAENFGKWTPEGPAFRRPSTGAAHGQNPVSGFLGSGLVNTFDPSDEPQGTLTSPSFIIKEQYISILVGGGNFPASCAIELVVDGRSVRSATGRNTEQLVRVEWDVAKFSDKEARLRIIDRQSGGWGHILVDDIRFSNLPMDAVTFEDADAWNDVLERLKAAPPMTSVGIGNGKAVRVPVELGGLRPGVDRLVQRDQVLEMLSGLSGVEYRPAVGRPQTAPSFGTMCLATAEPNVTSMPGWTDRFALYRAFQERDAFEPVRPGTSVGPSDPGETLNAALRVDATAPAGGTAEATFLVTWHFPHQYYPQNNWRMAGGGAIEVGNMYTGWYHDALGVARSVLADLDRLRTNTLAFRSAMFDTSLPQYFVDAVAANISILRSPTCFWTKDGTFYGFEGCNPSGGGCCPMNCNHVWNYEQTLAKLWPSLEANMRVTELKFHQRPDGGVHHRVEVPRDSAVKRHIAVADGQCGAVLKAYREHLQSRDRRFLDDFWPMIRKAMDFAVSEWDADGDGVMEKPQFNTYDRVIYGWNTFVSSLYLAALRAAEEMARLVKDDAAAERYRGLFEKGRGIVAGQLFDGEYYIQRADNLNLGYGRGCFSDQVVGQWWARILRLGDILPNDQVQSALKAIFKHNFLWTQEGFQGTQRFQQFADGKDKGLLCCSWPKGGRPDDPILYRDEIWTGIEYQVAAHKLYEGQIEEGLAIVRAARERYDGRKKSPWNEIECGDYYARALSSWSLLLAAQGYAYDGPRRVLAMDPRLTPDEHRSLFTTAEAWGRFAQKREGNRQVNGFSVLGGRLDLGELQLGLPAQPASLKGMARIGDRELLTDAAADGSTAVVRLHAPVTMQAGETLLITLDWT